MADDSSSDSDDQEYIPEGELPSSCSDVSEGDPEEVGERKAGRKKTTHKPAQRTRKRRGGAHLKEAPDNSDHSEGEGVEEEEEENEEEIEERKRARIDDLWASFKQNTGKKTHSVTDTKITSVRLETGGTALKPQTPRTVTIKETYDFAGEDVVVEKKVAADSKEALQFLKSHHDKNEGSQEGGSTLSDEHSSVAPSVVSPAAVRSSVASSSKQISGLGSVLQSLSKKPKISTLEKSRLDWVSYKRDEGLEEELSQHKKDGYLERQEFLQRTDIRQFQLEREERLKRFQRLK